MRILRSHGGPVRCVAYAPDGRTLASGGDDGRVRVWNLTTGTQRLLFGGPHRQGPRRGLLSRWASDRLGWVG